MRESRTLTANAVPQANGWVRYNSVSGSSSSSWSRNWTFESFTVGVKVYISITLYKLLVLSLCTHKSKKKNLSFKKWIACFEQTSGSRRKRRTRRCSGRTQQTAAADMDCIRNSCMFVLISSLGILTKKIVVFLSSVWNEKPVWYLLSLASATFHIQAMHAHSWHHAQCRSPPQVDTSHTAAPLFVLQIQDSASNYFYLHVKTNESVSVPQNLLWRCLWAQQTHAVAGRE